ncbi:hypothetical protein SLA2020_202060 [Shorea laevis]
MRAVSLLLKSFANFIPFLSPLLEKIPVKFLPTPVENMVALVSRTGRHMQRYDSNGCRLVVGCIPYRYKKQSTSIEDLEVLLISSQNGHSMLFPKGGWEKDECTMEQAVSRETIEEAGVIGSIECKLGKWRYKSKSKGVCRECCMFSLHVKQELPSWPEMNFRERKWVTVAQAKKECHVLWMKDALDKFVVDQMNELRKNETTTK